MSHDDDKAREAEARAVTAKLKAALDASVTQNERISLNLDVTFDEAREVINLLERLREQKGVENR